MKNPVIYADYPDVDVIRVGEKYYMVSTTMHMFPGCDLLMSDDLVNWELCCHVYDHLDHTPAQKLEEGHIYGKGMWAASLRYHEGVYHILFVCNDTRRSYHYTAEKPEGPWTYHPVEGFYHDCSILFDDDGRVYLAYGNREIHITEMEADLSRPKEGGLDRIALVDPDDVTLGFEGTHLYKRNGKYYLLMIHWHRDGNKRRTEGCYVADSIDGVFTGRDILDDDMGFFNQGVAQGGIVDTPDGRWYAMLFQDRGACGRMPVLIPMRWENDFPVLEKVPQELPVARASGLKPLIASDSLKGREIRDWWQWNHEPDLTKVAMTPGGLVLTALPASNLEMARNTLTQRTSGPRCAFEVTVDTSALKEGGRAGLCALQGCYAAALLERGPEGLRLVLETRTMGEGRKYTVQEQIFPVEGESFRLRAAFDYTNLKDKVQFFLRRGDAWQPLGEEHQLRYLLDHFMGCRIGLCCYGLKGQPCGQATFCDFAYTPDSEQP